MQHSLAKLELQPEKPTATLEVFITEKEKAEKSKLGQLFVLAEVDSRERGIKDKIKQLIDIVQNEYYASPTPDPEGSLETTCQNLNLNFADIMQKPEAWYKKVNILIGVLKDDILTFSHLGSFSAYLIRSGKVSQILNTQESEPEARLDSARQEELFSQITTGEVKAGDSVIVSTYSLFDFFSLEKIKKVVVKLNPEQAVHQFKNLIVDNIKVPNVLSLVVKYEKEKLAVQDDSAQTQKYLQELYGSQESMQQLENLKDRTGRTLSASMWPNLKKTKDLLNLKKKKPNLAVDAKKGLKLPKPKIKEKFKAPKLLSNAKNLFGPTTKKSDSGLQPLSVQKESTTELRVPKTHTPKIKPNMLKIIIVLVIIFLGSLIYLNFYQKSQQRVKANEEIISNIEDKKAQAEAALIYQDKEKANNLLIEAGKDLESLNQYNDEWVESYRINHEELVRLVNKINDIFEINVDTVASLGNIGIDSIDQIIKENGQLLVLTNLDSVYKINPKEKSFSEFFNKDGLKDMAVLEDESLILLTNSNEFYLRENENDKLLSFALAPEDVIIDFKTYGERIYYLDIDKGIYKVSKPLSAKPEVSVWYDENKDIIEKAEEIIIDGNVWIAYQNEIIKLFKGAQDEFELSMLDKNLGSDLKIYSEIESDYLYVIDKYNSRLLVIDKTGVVQRQFLNDKLKDVESLIVSNDESVAWFNVGGEIFEISLKQE